MSGGKLGQDAEGVPKFIMHPNFGFGQNFVVEMC
jgi:hypothetical protein